LDAEDEREDVLECSGKIENTLKIGRSLSLVVNFLKAITRLHKHGAKIAEMYVNK